MHSNGASGLEGGRAAPRGDGGMRLLQPRPRRIHTHLRACCALCVRARATLHSRLHARYPTHAPARSEGIAQAVELHVLQRELHLMRASARARVRATAKARARARCFFRIRARCFFDSGSVPGLGLGSGRTGVASTRCMLPKASASLGSAARRPPLDLPLGLEARSSRMSASERTSCGCNERVGPCFGGRGRRAPWYGVLAAPLGTACSMHAYCVCTCAVATTCLLRAYCVLATPHLRVRLCNRQRELPVAGAELHLFGVRVTVRVTVRGMGWPEG